MSSMFDKLVYPFYEMVVDYSCSLPCFKLHKANCQLNPREEVLENEKSVVSNSKDVNSRESSPNKIKKEYALLSAGQLATLRNLSVSAS